MPKITINSHNLFRGHLILVTVLMLLSVASLSVWYYMPIYPDEIAFRLQLSRYIQDKGLVHGLYSVCTSNVKDTPLLFVMPAWILSSLDLTLSPVQMRAIPFIITVMAVFITLWIAVNGRNPNSAAIATTAFIGVAGSGLVLARYEYAQILNIACCLAAILYLESESQKTFHRFFLFVLIFSSCLLSLYAHIQGLLFIPVSFFLMFLLIYPKVGKIKSLLLILILFAVITHTAIVFNHSSCDGYPGIKQFWSDMTLQTSSFKSLNLPNWLIIKIKNYLHAFLYKDNYTISYLPGITITNGWKRFIMMMLNRAIQGIVFLNFLLLVSATALLSVLLIKKLIHKGRKSISCLTNDASYRQLLILILFLAPLIFLFFYDAAQNFYRSFFINLLVAVFLAIVVSYLPLKRYNPLANFYFAACVTIVLVSFVANLYWFTSSLKDGFEGPSISLNKDWIRISKDVKLLALDSNIDLTKGRIIVDDLTYDSLKKYPSLYPITYLGLSSNLTGLSNVSIIDIVRPNYLIARCDSLHNFGLKTQNSRNQLCCINFLLADQVNFK